MNLLMGAMLHQFSKPGAGRYSYVCDDSTPGNWLVWDDKDGYAIYEENTLNEAVAITALLNVGLPDHSWDLLRPFFDDAVKVLSDPAVEIALAMLRAHPAPESGQP